MTVGQSSIDSRIVEQLNRAGENRMELERAIGSLDESYQPWARFLVAWMPVSDLRTVPADRLVENVMLAGAVRDSVGWQSQVPEEVFRNYVLPMSCLDEPRDPWRRDFHARFWPLVKDCDSITEAAQLLNQKIFSELKVKYSTERRRANQSPAESIEQGLASCSGLSIILVDACRSVGVPARIVGIPNWANKRGNHTWVEIWDGDWHFTGAAEYDPAGLNRAWFQADAALADPEKPANSIYAATYQPTGIHFPLVWDRENRTIPAVNVTRRYLNEKTELMEDELRVMIRARNSSGRRIAVEAKILAENGEPLKDFAGITRDESRDTNDFLEFKLRKDSKYSVLFSADGVATKVDFATGDSTQQMIDWVHFETADRGTGR